MPDHCAVPAQVKAAGVDIVTHGGVVRVAVLEERKSESIARGVDSARLLVSYVGLAAAAFKQGPSVVVAAPEGGCSR